MSKSPASSTGFRAIQWSSTPTSCRFPWNTTAAAWNSAMCGCGNWSSRRERGPASTLQSAPMILLLDNYDSFTFNLVQRIGEQDPSLELHVVRNDKISVEA